jgi:hypothetical protein
MWAGTIKNYTKIEGSGSAVEDLTAQETPQSSCSDQALHVYTSQDHPPSLTHYLFSFHCVSISVI